MQFDAVRLGDSRLPVHFVKETDAGRWSSNDVTPSSSVRLLASILAICTNGPGRWFDPVSTDQANHNSLPASVAPVIRGSARSNQRQRPGRRAYPAPRPTKTLAACWCPGAQQKTLSCRNFGQPESSVNQRKQIFARSPDRFESRKSADERQPSQPCSRGRIYSSLHKGSSHPLRDPENP